mgnify:CR=1 FL=1
MCWPAPCILIGSPWSRWLFPDPGLRLYEHVAQMAELMQRCDLAVSAAGTTLFELCSAGTPAVSFTMADNQFTTAVPDGGRVPEFLMQETSEPQKILPPAVPYPVWPGLGL